jgi:hypothetical protein
MADIGRALAEKRVAAILAVGPIGPSEVVDVLGSIKAAAKGTPKIVAIDEADAINKRFPGFESIDVPDGAFMGRPPVPDDTVTTLAVSSRPTRWFDFVAAAIAQPLFTAKEDDADHAARRADRGARHRRQKTLFSRSTRGSLAISTMTRRASSTNFRVISLFAAWRSVRQDR